MIGRTLALYIAWRFTKSLIAMMVLLLFLIVTVDFVEGLRRLNEDSNISAGTVYMISLYTAPYFIDKAFPFACLFAAMATLIQLNNRMELVVARTAGVSAWQFLMPIAGAAALIGVAAAAFYNPLAIRMYETSLDMKADAFGGRVDTNARTASGFWLRQDDPQGATIINAKLARRGGTQLDGVRIIRLDETGRAFNRIEAKSAVHRGDHWVVRDAVTTEDDQKAKRKPVIKLPTNVSSEYLFGNSGNPDATPFWDLRRAAQKVKLSGLNHLPYLVQFQNLLALPMFLVAMVIIAATVSLRFVRFGQAGKLILSGILGGFVLYAVARLVTSLGSSGIVPPVVAAWSPAFVAILFGMSILLHQEDG